MHRNRFTIGLAVAAATGLCLTFVIDSGLVRWLTFAALLVSSMRLWSRAQEDRDVPPRLGEHGSFHVVVEDLGPRKYGAVRLLRLFAGGAASRYTSITVDAPMDVGATESSDDADFVVTELVSIGASARREDRQS